MSSKFICTKSHTKQFNAIKEKAAQKTEHCHCNLNLQVTAKCDASRSGLGEVLEQNTKDGWKPNALASRFMNTTEKQC